MNKEIHKILFIKREIYGLFLFFWILFLNGIVYMRIFCMKVLNSEYIEENSITLDLEYFPVTRDGDKWTIWRVLFLFFLL